MDSGSFVNSSPLKASSPFLMRFKEKYLLFTVYFSFSKSK